MTEQPLLPIAEPAGVPDRLTTGPLPLYRHVPGLTPHPVKDPQGHLFAHPVPQTSIACHGLPAAWPDCAEYLYGVDLFNQAYLWEAHEAWEAVWIAAGKTTEAAGFVQGLIQVSAALLRRHLGTPRGARNLLARAWRKLDSIQRRQERLGQHAYMGIALVPWRQAVEVYLGDGGAPYPFLILEDP